jgi:hypothetical protein
MEISIKKRVPKQCEYKSKILFYILEELMKRYKYCTKI